MMLSKIADEIELLARADRWLEASLSSPASWPRAVDAERHRGDVRRAQGSALGARFPGGQVQAEALAMALAMELRRLCDAPRMLRFALEKGSWPKEFKEQARVILSGFEGLSH